MDTSSKKILKLTHLIGYLRQIPLLKDLPEQCIHDIALKSKVLEYKKEVAVIKANEPARYIGFLLIGQLKVTHISNNNLESDISFLNAPVEFGELSVIDQKPRSATLITNNRTLIAWLDGKIFLDMLLINQSLNLAMMRSISKKVRQANDRIFILSRKTAQSRLIAYLLRSKMRDVGGNVLALKAPTQTELASAINTTRETVSRILKHLEDESLIKKINREILIPSIDKLDQYLFDLEHNF